MSTPIPGGRRTPLLARAATAGLTALRMPAVGVEPRLAVNDRQKPPNSDPTWRPDLNGNQDPSIFDATGCRSPPSTRPSNFDGSFPPSTARAHALAQVPGMMQWFDASQAR